MSPGLPEEEGRLAIAVACESVHRRGWVANHEGNASVRLPDGRFLVSPTALSKAEVSPERVVLVDGQGQVLGGGRKVFSELPLHRALWEARPDCAAVLHAHPPYATAHAIAGVDLGPVFLAEAVLSLGPSIPLLPAGLSDEPALLEALGRASAEADVFLLTGHGVMAVGPDLATCLLRMEQVEALARLRHLSLPLGGPLPLPGGLMAALTARHHALFPRLGADRGSMGASGAGAALEAYSPAEIQRLVAEVMGRLGR